MIELLKPEQVLVIAFIIMIAIGTVLLSLPVATGNGQPLPFLDALFTSTSAVCVTGLVVADTATTFSTFGEMVIILLVQIGGLGITTVTTFFALMLGKKIGVKERLILRQAFNMLDMQGVVNLVLKVIVITLIIETLGFVCLSFIFVPDWGWKTGLYFAFYHSISAYNNGGFDLFGHVEEFSSLTQYIDNPWIILVISALLLLGSIGFIVVLEMINYPRRRRLSLHTKVVLTMTGLLIVIGTIVILLIEWDNPATLGLLSIKDKLVVSFFHAVTPRSGGFTLVSIEQMHPVTQFFTILLMFVGAAPNSTGGGIKVTTFAIILLAVWAMMRGNRHVVAYRRRIPVDQVYKALTVTVTFMALVIILTMLLMITEHTDILKAMFEAVSSFGTVGLSMGLTPELGGIGKITVIIAMFAGRLGPITLAVAIARNIDPPPFSYPEERPLIG
ncbi:TrkH family potassium uptake protein [Thermoactinomyces mirandus]|uniref:Trk family potassium uptake protein n=1 Tax=Thermoactinomyces mirandus TaxID=2756294 RepID=A0A7W1XUT9_9BACL|nr:TrkH family potassium uptake protein [Thermoactinomyces mirandus]MBA4603385.1 Trk family potassium uptake protein [Thermoactinomyces mirandus]